jgi:hypothetical protein
MPAEIPAQPEIGPCDLALFALRAIELSLLAPTAVITWADGVILAEDEPQEWVFELSLAPRDDPHEMIVRLRHVPGVPNERFAMQLVLGLLHREWRRSRLTVGQVRSMGWRLHTRGSLVALEGEADWGVILECECEELDEGRVSEREIRESIDGKLALYEQFERLLPPWA